MSVERIGIVLPDLAGGGVQRVLANLARGLAARGLEVVVCTLERRTPAIALPDGVEHVNLGRRGWVSAVVALRAATRGRRLDALVGGITRANLAMLAAAAGSGRRVRTIATKHLPVDMLSPRPARRRLLASAVRLGYRHADAVVAVSRGTLQSLIDLGLPASRLHRIANPVIGDDLDARCGAPVEHPWFVPGAPPVVLGVGRLTPQKDFGTLLRAFGRVRARCDARLVVLGDGVERGRLGELVDQQGLGDAVWFAGHVPDALPFMARAAVFASSSRWEGLPTVIIEALAAGAAVVASDCRTGPREILEDGALGILVPVGDVNALADGIRAALGQRPRVARERLQQYTVDHATARYLRLLETM